MNFFLSLSLVLFVVALNSSSACGFQYPHESKDITTPTPTACGGSLPKNAPPKRIHYRWYARHVSPFTSKNGHGLTSTSTSLAATVAKDNAADVLPLLRGLATRLSNEPRHWPFNSLPRDNAPETFEGARGFQAPYFAYAPRFSPFNMFPRDQAPFASGGPHGPYFADRQSYSPPQLLPSPFGGGHRTLTHSIVHVPPNGLLGSFLRKIVPSDGSRPVYFIRNTPNGRSIAMVRRLNKPSNAPPRLLFKPTFIGMIPTNQVGEFLRHIMGHGSTSSNTAFKTPTTNGNKPGPITYHRSVHVSSSHRHHFPRTVVQPLNIPKPNAELSQHQSPRIFHVYMPKEMIRSWFTPVPN